MAASPSIFIPSPSRLQKVEVSSSRHGRVDQDVYKFQKFSSQLSSISSTATCNNQSSAVSLSGITYERIRGTYTVKPVHFACSDSLPCEDVTLAAIQLKPHFNHLYDPFCWQTFGELTTPTLPPIDCLQIGKPSSNRIQSDHKTC